MSSLSSSSNSGSVEVGKSGNMSLLSLSSNCGSLEVWKCGNVPPLSLSVNTGSVEMWKNVSSLSLSNNSGSVEIWKSGNLQMCLVCFNLINLEVLKSGNVSGMISELKIGLACGEMTCGQLDYRSPSLGSHDGLLLRVEEHRTRHQNGMGKRVTTGRTECRYPDHKGKQTSAREKLQSVGVRR